MPDALVRYAPAGPTVKAFHRSNAFVRCLRGPLGSGKSTACVMEIVRRAREQAPGRDGVRRSRWAVIRNSYPELTTTTIKTWEQWVPPTVGKFSRDHPPTHVIRSDDFEMEVLFLALDREEDAKKLLSLELTGAWINEAREVPRGILDMLTGRVGRFPPMSDGGPTWSGIILDTNPPDSDHWLYKLAEEDRPEGFEFFAQPAGDGPDAENIRNLPPDYYARIKAGKSEDWIRVYVRGEYGFVQEGKPVYPEWSDSTHVAPEPFPPIEGLPLYIGLDFGLTPAAVFAQRTARGQWRVIDELVTEDMGMVRFSELLKARLASWYSGLTVEAYGDPAGRQRAQTDEKTCFDILRQHAGLRVRSAPSNDFTLRREAVASVLNRMVDGSPGFVLSPACKMLRKGFSGGYRYRRVKAASGDYYTDKPEKNEFSHPHDALQYLFSGAGEARTVVKGVQANTPKPTHTNVLHWKRGAA